MELSSLLTGTIGGIIFSGFIQYIINERRIKYEHIKSREENYSNLKALELKNESEKSKILRNEKIKAKQKILENLLTLNIECSLSMNYIQEDKEVSNIDIHDFYLKQTEIIIEAQTYAEIYFSEIIDYFNEIHCLSNSIWGLQQNYFGYSKKNEIAKNDLRIQLIDLFEKDSAVIKRVIEALRYVDI